jgi:hypothetical protein
MGAWDAGPFDNDDASDWAYEFEGVDAAAGRAIVLDALDLGPPGDDIEEPDAANAVAAVAVVSWMRDGTLIPDSPYGEDAAKWVRSEQPAVDDQLLEAALSALARVQSEDSELAALWAESDDGAWQDSLAELEARLRSPG